MPKELARSPDWYCVTVTTSYVWQQVREYLPSRPTYFHEIWYCGVLRTCSTEQGPSWEANRSSACHEIPRILWKPGTSSPHSQVPTTCPCHKPDRSNPCPQATSRKIHFSITLPSTPGCFKWFPSVRFPQQNLVSTCPFPHTVGYWKIPVLFNIWK